MRKFLLYSSALVLGLSGAAEAACIQTPSCSSLGYTSSSACDGGIKCPFGNAWNCTAPNKITELEKILEELKVQISTSNCKVGDYLFSDMTCGENLYPDKTAIGRVFDSSKGLAMALKAPGGTYSYGNSLGFFSIRNLASSVSGTYPFFFLSFPDFPKYKTSDEAANDWNGFENTKTVYEFTKSHKLGVLGTEIALSYSTEGTERGQWYLPSLGELTAIAANADLLDMTFVSSRISVASSTPLWGGTLIAYSGEYGLNLKIEYNDLSSSAGGYATAFDYYIPASSNLKFTLVINYTSKQKIDVPECMSGDILYSDKTCSPNEISGKTPIGVVFDGERKRALALKYLYIRSYTDKTFDIPLKNISSQEDIIDGLGDYDGKYNTQTILAYCKANGISCPAFETVNNYSTAGTKAGDWYIPSIGELYLIHNFIASFRFSYIKDNFPTGSAAFYMSSSKAPEQYVFWGAAYQYGPIKGTRMDDTITPHYLLPVIQF